MVITRNPFRAAVPKQLLNRGNFELEPNGFNGLEVEGSAFEPV
jgi:hypothetical protein